ncbi:hypothetical protein BU23DRAFT_550486 [Bimuria novae-zelandiae CBS 107.79]|uniref:Chitin-binding type-1 domain-containing protein n=1 Tax=Bimuria novae-zelandiae CBS 107.79 TaxID=1447943 RepID=A0A6A5VM84_9PLEO|nr:hypothetical protein BU23DRAFT_550486 [Bimuria novae-zelandiae CBS 107.79]
MRNLTFVLFSLASLSTAQNCGPKYDNQACAPGKCCSQYGWCDTGPAYCDPSNCQPSFSGPDSPCASSLPTTLKTSASKPSPTPPPFASQVPEIDVCGHAQGGVSCPGAGLGGYFYRCCSAAGHCGPKNEIQDQDLYCGTGCQAGYGKCDSEEKPAEPTGAAGTAGEGETCGPIVNKKCGSGLCCSGSNFCGTGEDFCGAVNWCQKNWGECS